MTSKKVILSMFIVLLFSPLASAILPVNHSFRVDTIKYGVKDCFLIHMAFPDEILYERFNDLNCSHFNGFDSCYGQNHMANVFTVGVTGPNIDHIVSSVKIYIYRGSAATVGTLTASIITTEIDAFGRVIPTNTVIASGTIPKSDIPWLGNAVPSWVHINFDKTGWLRKNTSYALVVKSYYDGAFDTTSWAYNYLCENDPYWVDYTLGGERQSNNGGVTWVLFGPSCLYEEYGIQYKAWLSLKTLSLYARVK
jgi:hypothetical protein